MNQVSFDISSERRGSEVAMTAAALRHEPYPVAA